MFAAIHGHVVYFLIFVSCSIKAIYLFSNPGFLIDAPFSDELDGSNSPDLQSERGLPDMGNNEQAIAMQYIASHSGNLPPGLSWADIKQILHKTIDESLNHYDSDNTNNITKNDQLIVDGESEDVRKERLHAIIEAWKAPPFTLQRLVEVLLPPGMELYKTKAKLLAALCKLTYGISESPTMTLADLTAEDLAALPRPSNERFGAGPEIIDAVDVGGASATPMPHDL